MRLSPAAFNAFLSGDGGIGQDFLWRPSTICPCITPHSGAASTKCPRCSGKGRVWGKAIPARAGMTNQKVDKTWAMSGQYQLGDATLTIPQSSAMYGIGQFDRVTTLNSTDPFSIALTHGAPTERLFFKVENINRVYWYTGPDGTGDLTEGVVPQVSDGGLLSWPNGAPPAGKVYSISGTRYTEYYVYQSLASDRQEHYGAKLPKKLIARLFDVFGR